MIKIAVCIKQVPKGVTKMDDAGILIRNELVTNPYDYYALEQALILKDKYGAKIDVFSLAPPKCKENFKEQFALGVDNCYHIVDDAFRGADVFATAYTISSAIKKIDNYDLILCGRQTTDGDTSAVSCSIAENLSLPSVMYVLKVDNITDNTIVVTRQLTNKIEQLEVKMPAVLSVEKDTVIPRIATLKNKLLANKKIATTITINDLDDTNPNHYGEFGSKTKVLKIYEQTPLDKGIKVEGTSEEIANFIISEVKKVIK